MAIVYAARDIKMNREVAIKVLLPDLAMAMGEERFMREIEIAAQLSNPHILAVYDSGNANGQLYYVMPMVRGQSLRDRLDREKQLPVDEALRLSIEVAEALDYAHRHGVIHRDIKPENILLEEGHAIVADFGIARAISTMNEGAALTATGMSLGTAAYMSPEQGAAEKSIDGRSDIYSLACVTYEMLAGHAPFTGSNTMAIMARHALEMPPSLTIIRQAIPDEVEETVFQALAKSPVDRFETAAEFAEALQSCLLVAPTSTRRTPQVRMTQATKARRLKRQRKKVFTVGGIAVGVLALSVAGWLLVSNAGNSPGADAPRGLDKKSIAVLYFKDQSPDSSLGHVADALTEGLIDELSAVNGLRVVSRDGSARYRGTSAGIDSVARALQTGTVIEGDVEKSGNEVLVTARLFDASGGRFGLATIKLPTDQLLAVRDSVVRQTADILRDKLGGEVQLSESRAGTSNTDAWSHLQLAERLRKEASEHRESGEDEAAAAAYARADSLLLIAEKADPSWAEPLVLRGQIALERSALETESRKREPIINQAIDLTSRALALQKNHSSALALRGRARRVLYQLDLASDPVARNRLLDSAAADLTAATASDPNNAAAHFALSQLYYDKEDNVSALIEAQRAYETDAFLRNAERNLMQLFWTNYDTEGFDKARTWCERGADRFPTNYDFAECQLWLMITEEKGPRDIKEAWRLAARAEELAPPNVKPYEARLTSLIVAGVLARQGAPDSARKVLLKARGAGKDIDPGQELPAYEAIMRVILGDHGEAVTLLKQYVLVNPTHEFTVQGKDYHWWWRPLRDFPGFRDVAQRKR